MKVTSMVFLVFLISQFSVAQKHFKLNAEPWLDTISITVNGKAYQIDSNFIKIKTRYPAFDTLVIEKEYFKDTKIICSFKPNTSYTFKTACCATVDIVESNKLKNDSLVVWGDDLENNIEKIKSVMMNRPSVTLAIKNGVATDSIYGWYVDGACFPSFKLLDEKGWKYGVPVKCFYWTNISTFLFFKSHENYQSSTNNEGIVEDIFPENIEELGMITVRLFDNNNYIITYDGRTKKISIERN